MTNKLSLDGRITSRDISLWNRNWRSGLDSAGAIVASDASIGEESKGPGGVQEGIAIHFYVVRPVTTTKVGIYYTDADGSVIG